MWQQSRLPTSSYIRLSVPHSLAMISSGRYRFFDIGSPSSNSV